MKTPYQGKYLNFGPETLFQLSRLRQRESLLVFFHGVGDSHINFKRFFEHPKLDDYDLFIADLLGHGCTSDSSDYSFLHQCEALTAQLIKWLPHYRKVVFIPHSMGGIHATMLANTTLKPFVSGIFAIETSITQYGSFIAH